jgi:hypothetical protein
MSLPPPYRAVQSLPLPYRAVQFHASDATISRAGGFSDVHLTVLATTLDQDLSDDVGRDVELVPSAIVASPVALAPRLTCLRVPTPDALTRPSDTNGTSNTILRALLRLALFLISWHFVILNPRIMCVLFRKPAWGLGYVFLLRMSLASTFPLIAT